VTGQSRPLQSIGPASVVAVKARVVFEQYVSPRTRVPFFAALAEKVDLLVVTSSERRVDSAPRG